MLAEPWVGINKKEKGKDHMNLRLRDPGGVRREVAAYLVHTCQHAAEQAHIKGCWYPLDCSPIKPHDFC